MSEERLSKGIYGYETDRKKLPLGLFYAQTRANAVIFNAGWYNKNGERLGYGDLSMADMSNISKKLNANEIFIAMAEADSVWNLPKDYDRTAPGIEYVCKHMLYMIAAGGIFNVSSQMKAGELASLKRDDVAYHRVARVDAVSALKKILKSAVKEDVKDLVITQEQIDLAMKRYQATLSNAYFGGAPYSPVATPTPAIPVPQPFLKFPASGFAAKPIPAPPTQPSLFPTAKKVVKKKKTP